MSKLGKPTYDEAINVVLDVLLETEKKSLGLKPAMGQDLCSAV